MQIGRKIYYDKITGNILVDTGERQGNVVETTVEQDFQTYLVLSERVPETVGVIQLSYGQFANEFAQYQLRIDPATNNLLWTPHSNGTLEDAKKQKVKQLNEFCNAAILAGFTSNALGTDNTYDFDYDAQINLGGMLNAITAGLVTGNIVWKASGNPQPHTFEQFKVVFSAGLEHKNAMIGRFWLLKSAVLAAESEEEIDAIVW
jgi:hypothetical protein